MLMWLLRIICLNRCTRYSCPCNDAIPLLSYIHTHTRTHKKQTQKHTHRHTQTHTHMYMYVYVYVYVCICMHMYVYVYVYIYIISRYWKAWPLAEPRLWKWIPYALNHLEWNIFISSGITWRSPMYNIFTWHISDRYWQYNMSVDHDYFDS